MSLNRSLLSSLMAAMLMVFFVQAAHANDLMFMPAPAAQKAISIDGKGFIINGKRTFVVSGSLHYARLPAAQWKEMLLKFKRAGYNTVQTYVFWNWQEPREGQWNFSGSHNLDGFLKLVKQLGMYATVRVGPYCCAEWDSGGYPVWLRFKPGLIVRTDNPAYMAEADKWYNKILPIVAANQINHGGSVILVQLENEDREAWGTSMPNSYFQKLHDIAIQDGIEVPFFFSGMHHGSDPAGNNPWDNADRATPWYSTEFWAGWIKRFGPPTPPQLLSIVRGDWKLQAYGANGYNQYMFYGGTNFGWYNNDEDAASYDYGAAISQSGGLRKLYYDDKRAALFGTTFSDILENSNDATAEYANVATAPGIRVTARKGPAGTILYLDNNSSEPVQTQIALPQSTLPASSMLTIAPGEIMPIVTGYTVAPGVTLAAGLTHILAIAHNSNTTTLVSYGADGTTGQLLFQEGTKPVTTVPLTFQAAKPNITNLTLAGQAIRIVAEDNSLADRTWFVGPAANRDIVIGPDYVGESAIKSGKLTLEAETADNPVLTENSGKNVWFIGSEKSPQHATLPAAPSAAALPVLGIWHMSLADSEAQPDFNDSHWLKSAQPQQMGADGYPGAYTWYRSAFTVPASGSYTLHFADVGDWLQVFIDGKPQGSAKIIERDRNAVPRDISVTLPQGEHTLAVFTAQYGRDKLYNYYGPINQIAAKGLNGPVTLVSGTTPAGMPIINWSMHGGASGQENAAWTDASGSSTGVPTYYKATFMYHVSATGQQPVLRATFAGLSQGFMYLNGHNLGRYPEKCPTDSLYLPEAYLKQGLNTLTVFDEEGHSPAQVTLVPATEATHTTAYLTFKKP